MKPTVSMRRWRSPSARLEKLWVAAVDKFAIGGGCQLLLVVDYVIAETGSYFSLPARKEGFLPGTSNMRLPRYVGERLAREALLFDRVFHADTPEGRLIANEVVPSDEIDEALARCVERTVGSGMVSPGANRNGDPPADRAAGRVPQVPDDIRLRAGVLSPQRPAYRQSRKALERQAT